MHKLVVNIVDNSAWLRCTVEARIQIHETNTRDAIELLKREFSSSVSVRALRQEWSAGVGRMLKVKRATKSRVEESRSLIVRRLPNAFNSVAFHSPLVACTLSSSECWWNPTVTPARKILLIDFSFSPNRFFILKFEYKRRSSSLSMTQALRQRGVRWMSLNRWKTAH